ncbi:MAG: glycosyltransferase family 2 protein, partial [Planctomycetes bacterium]|nr:glycosyltransferase family 2 protein [Planctomycetota bacterium]
RRRERSPEASVWNRLCDLEWDTPTGPASATGGDFVVRASAFQEVGGFDESFVAGEEPELGLRLRRAGWEIERLDREMTLHDADMTRFGQWWRRCRRAGQAFLHGYLVHGDGPERFWRREALRPLLWVIALPALTLALLPMSGGWSLLLCLLFPLQAARITRSELRRQRSLRDALLYSTACLVGHFAELSGQAGFLVARMSGHGPLLLEYKRPLQGD